MKGICFALALMAFLLNSALAEETRPLLILPTPLETHPPVSKIAAAPISLEDLQAKALRHHPALQVAAARWNEAQGKQYQAGRYPNPVAGYHGTEIGNQNTAGQQGAFVSQRFITGHKRELDQAAAGEKVRQANHLYFSQQQRILTDVAIRFYETLAAQKTVELSEHLAAISDDAVTATERLLEARQSSENELLQALIQSDQAEIRLADARNQHQEAWRRLSILIGELGKPIVLLDGQLESANSPLDWEMCYAAVLASHPELSAARSRAAQTRLLITRAEKEPIPDVDVSVSVRHIFPTDSDVANAQVGIPLTIFDKNRGNIRAAEAAWIAACQEVKRVELQLQDQLTVTYRRYANAQQQQQKYREKILPRAERSLKLVQQGYESGQVAYLTVLATQQTYIQAQLTYINTLRDMRSAEALLEGKLLDSSLQQR